MEILQMFYNINTTQIMDSLTVFLVVWLILHQSLYKDLMEYLFEKLYSLWYNDTWNWFVDKLDTLLGCAKCVSFWCILIATHNPLLALIGAFIASLYTKIIEL